jgi:hypothetical protein
MHKISCNKVFNLGFIAGMLLLLIANYFTYLITASIDISHYTHKFGFPFSLYKWGGYSYEEGFLWLGLVANISIAVIFSFSIGLIFKFIWSKIASRRLQLK